MTQAVSSLRRRWWPCAAILIAALYLAPAVFASDASNPVIQDCLNHPAGLTGRYTVAELNHALAVMSPEHNEYTNCPDVINRARLAALKGLHGGGGGGGSFLPTPVLIILIIVVLGAITFGAVAVRRRQGPGGAGGPPPAPSV